MSETKRREDRQRQREQEGGEALHPDASDPQAEDPHAVLNKPAADPDPTEFPEPYDRRPDPRDPGLVDTPALPEERTAGEGQADRPDRPRAPSTSEPHPPRNYDELKPVKGDRED